MPYGPSWISSLTSLGSNSDTAHQQEDEQHNDFIRKTEVGTEARKGYDVIYANKQGALPKPITSMTVAELQGHQSSGWPAVSTASGGYQFMKDTLKGLRNELRLSDTQIFSPDLQDRLGYHLLKRRGYELFMAGQIGVTEFGKRLSQEWASFPVLADTKGGSRTVKRGQSYYAGDGLNKALVKPEQIEALLDKAKKAEQTFVPPQPMPEAPKRSILPWIIGIVIIAAIAFFVTQVRF